MPRLLPVGAVLAVGVASALILASCGEDDVVPVVWSPPPTVPRNPTRIVLTNPKALFVGDGNLGGAAPDPSLFEILPDGTVQVVPFLDEDGNEVTVKVTKLMQLGKEHIGIYFTYEHSNYRVVTDVNDGVLLDFSDNYALEGATVRDGFLYVRRFSTIYRIDLADRTATPMNNPDFDPVTEISAVVSDGNVVVNEGIGGCKLLFADNSIPVDLPSTLWNCLNNNHREPIMMGEDGNVYECGRDNALLPPSIPYLYEYSFDASGMHTVTTEMHNVACEKRNPVEQQYPYRATPPKYYSDVYWPLGNGVVGYFHLTPVAGAGYTWDLVERNMPGFYKQSDGSWIPPRQVGHTLYARDEDTVRKFDFVNDADISDVVTHANMIDWRVAGGNVFFTAYITGTEIGTYRVESDLSVTLIQSSDMAIKDIVEFSLP